MSNKKPRVFNWVRYEVILMIALICCIAYCVSYENIRTHDNVISVTKIGTICILHEDDVIDLYREQGRPVIPFHHDACQFITVYNPDRSLKSIVMLSEVESLSGNTGVSIENWWNLFEVQDKGQIDLSQYGHNIVVHFEWVRFDDGTEYLVVYNISESADLMFTTFNYISYTALILAFILLASNLFWRSHGIAKRYQQTTTTTKEILRGKD